MVSTLRLKWCVCVFGCILGSSGELVGQNVPSDIQQWMMPWSEYAGKTFDKPYILRIEHSSGGELVYFGAEHSRDPNHAQFERIETLWSEFKPQHVFFEGQAPQTFPDRNAAIKTGGEPGFALYLAQRYRASAESMDATLDDQATFLLRTYPIDQVRLYFTLRQIVKIKRTQPGQTISEESLDNYLSTLSKFPSLEGKPETVEEFDQAFSSYFPPSVKREDAIQKWFDPLGGVNWVNEASRDLANHRNVRMIEKLTTHVQQGKRVFAIVGRTHAIIQEPALRRILQQP